MYRLPRSFINLKINARTEYPIFKVGNTTILGSIHARSAKTLPQEFDFNQYNKLITEGLETGNTQKQELKHEEEMVQNSLQKGDLVDYLMNSLFVYIRKTSISNTLARNYEIMGKRIVRLDSSTPEAEQLIYEESERIFKTKKLQYTPKTFEPRSKKIATIANVLSIFTNMYFFKLDEMVNSPTNNKKVDIWMNTIKDEIDTGDEILVYAGMNRVLNLIPKLQKDYPVEQYDYKLKRFVPLR